MKHNYKLLVEKYASALDLFGPAVLQHWERHEAAARLYAAQLPPGAHLLDVGSGGGLPGVVIAQARPDVKVTLCERRSRRSSFLRLVLTQLELANAELFAGDVRSYPGKVSWVSAQAVADLPQLLALVERAVEEQWTLLTRRPHTWYAPRQLMGFSIQEQREPLDDQHDLVVLSFRVGAWE